MCAQFYIENGRISVRFYFFYFFFFTLNSRRIFFRRRNRCEIGKYSDFARPVDLRDKMRNKRASKFLSRIKIIFQSAIYSFVILNSFVFTQHIYAYRHVYFIPMHSVNQNTNLIDINIFFQYMEVRLTIDKYQIKNYCFDILFHNIYRNNSI